MRKVILFATTFLAVLVLAACDTYDLTYDYYSTTQEIGADTCYISGSDVILNPIIDIGYTEEEEEAQSGSSDSDEDLQWMLEEFSFVLDVLEDGEYVQVATETVDFELNDDQYQEAEYLSNDEIFDYESFFDDDIFNLGELEDGEYRFELTSVSRYMVYTPKYDTSDTSRDTSQGTTTEEVKTTVEFLVDDECTSDFDGVIVYGYNDYDEGLPFSFIGIDSEGNILSNDDVVFFEQLITDSYYDEDYGNVDDIFYENFDDDEYDIDYMFSNISREELRRYNSGSDGNDLFYPLEQYVTYGSLNFDIDNWNGNFLVEYSNYLENNNEDFYEFECYDDEIGDYVLCDDVDVDDINVLEDFYITVKLGESNVYKDILVVFTTEENAPEFTNVPMDQWIVEGDDLDLESMMPTATDDTEGDISDRIMVELPDTTMLPLGDYTITYTVSDLYGNEATASFVLSVLPPDDVAPVITVNTELPTTFDEGSAAPNLLNYFSVTDERYGDIAVTLDMLSFDPMLDMNTPGSYDITLTVSDPAGNEQTEMITIEILLVDVVPPLIGLTDQAQVFFDEGENGPDFTTYFTVLDDVDGEITVTESMLSFDTAFDTNTPGTYNLTLTVSDAAGNVATQVVVITVLEFVDSTPPVFDNVPLDQVITEGDMLDLYDLGLTASDDVDGDLTPSIQVDIDDTTTLAVGNYTVTYSVTDAAGNEGTTKITLTVNAAIPDYTGNVVSAIATTSTDIDVVFDVFVLDNLAADPTAFSVVVNGTPVTVTGVTIEIDNVIVSIDTHMTIDGTVTISYMATGVTDLTHEFVLVPDFTDQVVDTSDFEAGSGGGNEETGDVVAAVASDANTVEILFDVVALENTQVDLTAFTVTIDGTPATITNAQIVAGLLSLTVTETMGEFSVITTSYAPTGTNDLTFDNGRPIAGYINLAVVSPFGGGGGGSYTGNVFLAAAFDSNTIDITFDVDMFDANLVDITAFTVTIDGVTATITGAFVNINLVSLTITETMDEFSFVEVSYNPTGTNDLTFGGTPVPSFTDEPVVPPGSFGGGEGGEFPPGF